MRGISTLWFSSLILTGCLTKGADNSAAKSAAYDLADQDIASEVGTKPGLENKVEDIKIEEGKGEDNCANIANSMCTMEYNPQICLYDKQIVEGGNLCGAMKLAKQIACESKKTFKESDIRCKAQNECLGYETRCTRELLPQTCTIAAEKSQSKHAGKNSKTLSAQGNNRCMALNQLAVKACMEGVEFNRDAAKCEAGH